MSMNRSFHRRLGGRPVLAVSLAALLLGTSATLSAAAEPAVDGDEALRCAVERAVDLAEAQQALGFLGTMPDKIDALRAGASDETLVALGLADAAGQRTALGDRVIALADAPTASAADLELALGSPLDVTTAQPGVPARLRLDTTGSNGQTVVVTVSPAIVEGEGCPAGFDPVIRATLPGAEGMELVARGTGPVRTATLVLHNVPDGTPVDLSIVDVVGAPGRFEVSAEAWSAPAPTADESTTLLSVGDGPLTVQEMSVDGDRVVFAVSLEEGFETVLRVRGLAGAQPGVRVYQADDFGNVSGDAVYSSAFVPVVGATVDLAAALAPGFYAVSVEDIAGRPGVFLVDYSNSPYGAGFRTSGTIEVGDESLQALNSDLGFSIAEAGWYAFSTSSLDDVDPVLSLLDGEGYVIQESDDDAFSLHPLIIAELQPGDYSLALDGFDGMPGEVTLGAWRVEPPLLELGTVGLEQTIATETTLANFNIYRIVVEANELVDIDVEGAGDFDSTLALYDPWDMTVWVADDDGGVGYGSRIIDSFEGLDLLAVVASYDGARGGAYTISAVDHARMENIDETAVMLAPGGGTATGSLPGEGDISWFRIADGGDGDWHTITVRSQQMPYLTVDLFRRQADGYLWIDGLEGYDGLTEVSFEGDGSGDIFALVRNPSGEGAGDFTAEVD